MVFRHGFSNGFTHIQECHLIESPPKFGPGFQKSAGCYHLQMVWINNQDGRISVVVSSKRKNPKPTSGHLEIRNLNQPLDTKKVKATSTHRKCPEVVFVFFATRLDEAKQENKITKTTSGHHKINAFPWVLRTSRNFMFFQIFEFLTAPGLQARFKKVKNK